MNAPGVGQTEGRDELVMPCASVACGGRSGRKWPRRASRLAGVTLPGVMLALIPKCPACLAAYLALGTGIGLSFETAQWLQWLLVGVSLALLGYFAVRLCRDETGWLAAWRRVRRRS